MFCAKCGNPMDDDALFCTNCGAGVAKEVPAEEPAAPVEEAPVCPEVEQTVVSEETVQEIAEPEVPAFELNTEGEVAKPKKKISPLPFILGGVAVVVVVALLAIFNWSNFSGFFERTFSSPEKLQTKVYEDVVAQAFDNVTGTKDGKKQEATVDPNNYGLEGEIRLTIDDQVMSLIPDVGVDLSWLSNIAVGYDISEKDAMGKIAMNLLLGDTSIISLDGFVNEETGEVWYSVPDFSDDALYINVYDFMEDYMGYMPSIYDPENLAMIEEILPSEEVLEQIITRYVGIVMSGFGDVEKSSETVKVGGISQKLYVLKATMDEDDLVEIAENLVKTLKKDKDVKNILLAYEEYIGEEGFYDYFVEAMDEALESIEETDMDDMISFKVTLLTYLNDANEIVGVTVKASSMGEKLEPISWIRVEQGKKFASELVISSGSEAIVLEGKGETDKATNSKYVLSYDGDEILNIEVKDYISNDEQISGTVRIKLAKEILEDVMEDAYLDESIANLIGSAEPALEIKFASDSQKFECSIALVVGSKSLITLSTNGKWTAADAIVPPENYVEVEDEDDLMDWAGNMKSDFLETLMNRLIEAGVPSELFALALYSI